MNELNRTLAEIGGEQRREYNWQNILPLLGCDYCSFANSGEERIAFEWMVEKIKTHGEDWVRGNACRVIGEWEDYLQKFKAQQKKEQKKRKMKRWLRFFSRKDDGKGVCV